MKPPKSTLLDQLAAAGVFFLTISGGEPLIRPDCFEIIEHARKLRFNVKFKTNAVLIREKQARRLRELNVEQVQISVYSHRAEIHDGISKVPGSLKRTIAGIRLLKSHGLKVTIANVLMKGNLQRRRRRPPTGRRSRSSLHPRSDDHAYDEWRHRSASFADLIRQPANRLPKIQNWSATSKVLRAAPPVDEDAMEIYPCSAGHRLLRLAARRSLSLRAISHFAATFASRNS
jgi:organic radical activating enzyme